MTHRALHNSVRRNPTEARAKYMPHMVDRKVSYSRVPSALVRARLRYEKLVRAAKEGISNKSRDTLKGMVADE